MGPRVSSSQSTMAMSSLIPSASMEPISDFGNRKPMHNRSVSEPDFGRTQVCTTLQTGEFSNSDMYVHIHILNPLPHPIFAVNHLIDMCG